MIARVGRASNRVHVAVVHGPEMEPYVVMGASRDQVVRRLARFVGRRAPQLLWPGEAKKVADLLGSRELEEAVDAYFDALGDPERGVRWERQRVVYRSMPWPANGTPGAPHGSAEELTPCNS